MTDVCHHGVSLGEACRRCQLEAAQEEMAEARPDLFVFVNDRLHIRSDAPADATCPCCDEPLATSPLPRWPKCH